jgi:hypothetical protein
LSAELYEDVTGRDAHSRTLLKTLSEQDAAHPAECVRATWELAVGKGEPWAFVKKVYQSCALLSEGGHTHERKRKGEQSTNGQRQYTTPEEYFREVGARGSR